MWLQLYELVLPGAKLTQNSRIDCGVGFLGPNISSGRKDTTTTSAEMPFLVRLVSICAFHTVLDASLIVRILVDRVQGGRQRCC